MKQWKKRVSAISIAFLICIMMISGSMINVHAAGANVTMAVTSSSVKIGDSITVTVNISSSTAIGSYSMAVTYNSGVLEYTGGSGNGGGGTVMIAGYGDGTATRLSSTLSFKAIANGSSTISTSGGEAYAWDESSLAISHAGITVNVATVTETPTTASNTSTTTEVPGSSATEKPVDTSTTEVPGTDTPASSTEERSNDNLLKSLEISPGTLEPAFSPSIRTYTVNLPEDTKVIYISAAANDSKAAVTVSHNADLEPGANRSYIVVTAEDGSQRTYTLNVNCGEVDAGEEKPILIDGISYAIATGGDMADITIPEDFSLSDAVYGGQTISVFKSPNQRIMIVYLIDEEGHGTWFIYDDLKQEFHPFVDLQTMVNHYVFLELSNDVVIPEGYEPVRRTIQGKEMTVYVQPGEEEFVLVYAMNIQRDEGFYIYDSVENTLQRYVAPEPEEVTTEDAVTTEEASQVIPEPVVTEDEKVQRMRVLMYILSGIVILLLGMNIFVLLKMRKQTDATEESDLSSSKNEDDPDK